MTIQNQMLLFIAAGTLSIGSMAAATAPPTQDEMDRWINAQVENPAVSSTRVSFFGAIDSVYKSERRDDSWAGPVEGRLKSLLQSKPGAAITGGNCRASVCRFEISFTKGIDAWDTLTLGSAITQSVHATPQQVTELHRRNSARVSDSSWIVHEVIYLLSDSPSAAWYGPLRKQLGMEP